jgi:hypothetical protein
MIDCKQFVNLFDKLTDKFRKMKKSESRNGVTVVAYQGDATTLLAFDISDALIKPSFVGFTVTFQNSEGHTFLLMNKLSFVTSGKPLRFIQIRF